MNKKIDLSCLRAFVQRFKLIHNSIKILGILPNDANLIMKYLDYGLDDYLIENIYTKDDLFCRISKLTISTTNYPILEIKNYNSLYLDPIQKKIYLYGITIPLSNIETMFIYLLIDNSGYLDKESLLISMKKDINPKYNNKRLVMMISRLRMKIKYLTGSNIIKSKYSEGYYIDL